jgi:hypothetical protein
MNLMLITSMYTLTQDIQDIFIHGLKLTDGAGERSAVRCSAVVQLIT